MLHIPILHGHDVSKQIPREKIFHRVENVIKQLVQRSVRNVIRSFVPIKRVSYVRSLPLSSSKTTRRERGGGYLRMIDTFRNYTRKQKIVLDTTERKVETVHISVPFFTRSSPPGVEV